jgi:hypothetical protein
MHPGNSSFEESGAYPIARQKKFLNVFPGLFPRSRNTRPPQLTRWTWVPMERSVPKDTLEVRIVHQNGGEKP